MGIMRSTLFLLILYCGYANSQSKENANKKVVCYYTNWSSYRPNEYLFKPKDINPFLCTHLIYAFVALDKENDGIKPFDPYQDLDRKGFLEFAEVKKFNEDLKNLAAVGGWRAGSETFSAIAASQERRTNFASRTIEFLRKYNFDGINIDWQFPVTREGGRPEDFENFVLLVKELHTSFVAEKGANETSRLLVTMSVPANTEFIDKGYDLLNLSKYADFITVLCYDYHYSTDPFVNHHSPIYPLPNEVGDHENVGLNMDSTVKFVLEKGVPRDKFVLGIPAYGRTYLLEDESMNEIGAPADGQGTEGKASQEIGYKTYYEICANIKDEEGWTVVHVNKTAMGPYAYKGKDWVSYDDSDSARRKGEYARDMNLAGIMFWTIDDDDFRGWCGRGNPLIKSAREGFFSKNPNAPTTIKPTVAPTVATTAEKKKTEMVRPMTSMMVDDVPVAIVPMTPATFRTTPTPKTTADRDGSIYEFDSADIYDDSDSIIVQTTTPTPARPRPRPKPVPKKPTYIVSRETNKDDGKSIIQTISIWINNNIFHLGSSKQNPDIKLDLST